MIIPTINGAIWATMSVWKIFKVSIRSPGSLDGRETDQMIGVMSRPNSATIAIGPNADGTSPPATDTKGGARSATGTATEINRPIATSG